MKRNRIEIRGFTLELKRLLWDEYGGGLSILFIGISIIALVLVIFLNIADYSVYTYKRNEITKAMDYAVTAAAQQLKTSESLVGLSSGFSDHSGKKLLENVEINIDKASVTFTDILSRNNNIPAISINDRLLLCSTYSEKGRVKYTVKANGWPLEHGETGGPQDIEAIINDSLEAFWPESHKTLIYVNGNPYTNMVEKGTYLFAVIKDVEITGIFSKRKISLSSFAGAKLERLAD